MPSPVYDHTLAMKARDFAVRVHAGQQHGSMSLIGHLDETVRLLMKMKVESSTIAAGYLHMVSLFGNQHDLDGLLVHFSTEILTTVKACAPSAPKSRAHAESMASKIALNPESARVILAAGLSLMSRPIDPRDTAQREAFCQDLPFIWFVLHGAHPMFADRLLDLTEVTLTVDSGRYALTI